MRGTDQLRVKLFADGAELEVIRTMAANPLIKGFTTNPTLMRKAGVSDYVAFSREALRIVPDRPISFEVFSDDFVEMEAQALEIASWGSNVFVKIPVTNTRGESAAPLVSRLARAGRTAEHYGDPRRRAGGEDRKGTVAGRGVVRVGIRRSDRGHRCRSGACDRSLVGAAAWLAARRGDLGEPARAAQCVSGRRRRLRRDHRTADVLNKLSLVGKNLTAYSLETVEMFREDALAAGYTIPVSAPVREGVSLEVP